MTLIKYRVIDKRASRQSTEGMSSYLGEVVEEELDDVDFENWLETHGLIDELAALGPYLHDRLFGVRDKRHFVKLMGQDNDE